jgi:putative SOS response-associated peptidase YedK
MCGRYYRRSDKQWISEHFRVRGNLPDFVPDHNIAPTTFQPVIRLDRETGERELATMRWGLVPHFAKDLRDFRMNTINAKAEALMTSAMWRLPFTRRRCLVPADGFYEWRKLDEKTKQPYAFAMKNGDPFAFAGIWTRWMEKDGKPLESYAIITTDPNELAASVHNRMPVILKPQDYERWLTRDDTLPPPLDLLRPYDADAMTMWEAHKDVGNVKNNRVELLNSA